MKNEKALIERVRVAVGNCKYTSDKMLAAREVYVQASRENDLATTEKEDAWLALRRSLEGRS